MPSHHDDRERWVTSVTMTSDGYIAALWNDNGDWPGRNAEDVLSDIELGVHSYWVRWLDGATEVVAAPGPHGLHLTTSHRGGSRNELADLPRRQRRAG